MRENIYEKKYIDLHVHSTASDGTYTPSEVTEYAKEKGLYAFALTDHDTVDGIEEAMRAAGGSIIVIPGIEISADYNGTDIHILGLNIDYKNEEFLAQINECKRLRTERNKKMIQKMNALGFPITEDIVNERYGRDSSVTRAHFARYLLDEGFVSTKEEAFAKYLNKGCPCYVSRVQMTPEHAVKIILKAGGHPVLAHPLLYKLEKDKVTELIDYLKGLGLKGLEAVYSRNTAEDDEFLAGAAKSFGLFVTGGSDFHGSNKPDIDLGVGTGNLAIGKELLKNIL